MSPNAIGTPLPQANSRFLILALRESAFFFEKKRFLSFINEKDCTKLKGLGKRRKLKCILRIDIQTLKDDLKKFKIMFCIDK
jgi:hypothetical protein